MSEIIANVCVFVNVVTEPKTSSAVDDMDISGIEFDDDFDFDVNRKAEIAESSVNKVHVGNFNGKENCSNLELVFMKLFHLFLLWCSE